MTLARVHSHDDAWIACQVQTRRRRMYVHDVSYDGMLMLMLILMLVCWVLICGGLSSHFLCHCRTRLVSVVMPCRAWRCLHQLPPPLPHSRVTATVWQQQPHAWVLVPIPMRMMSDAMWGRGWESRHRDRDTERETETEARAHWTAAHDTHDTYKRCHSLQHNEHMQHVSMCCEGCVCWVQPTHCDCLEILLLLLVRSTHTHTGTCTHIRMLVLSCRVF